MISVCTTDEMVKYKPVGQRSAIIENFSTDNYTIGMHKYTTAIYKSSLIVAENF